MRSLIVSAIAGFAMTAVARDLPLQPAPVIHQLEKRHLDANRRFQGIPGMACAPGGRLWATWYAGGAGEGPENFVLLVTSGDDGETWSGPLLAIDPPGTVRAFDPCLWLDPAGRLWLFYAQSESWYDGRAGVWALRCDQPDQAEAAWTEPVRIADGIMMNKPIVLADGTWALPVAIWNDKANHHPELDAQRGANVVVSTDNGQTWEYRGGAGIDQGRDCDEHMLIERRDGALWMLIRTGYGIGESESHDGGRTWSPVAKWSIEHTTSRFFITRLHSGNLLLVKHGPLNVRGKRELLTAYLSEDDGATWGGGLLLDARPGVSYPDGCEAPDGTIRIVYDFQRTMAKEILMARFAEADVRAGQAVSGQVSLRGRVNQATGGADPAAFDYRAHADGAPLLTGPGAQWELGHGAQTTRLRQGEALFADRAYVLWEAPDALAGRSFARSSIDRTTAVCTQAGVAFVVTPLPDRNADSVVAALGRQGFVRARLPEFLLMLVANGEANIVTTYQKLVKVGERIDFGKWGVLIF